MVRDAGNERSSPRRTIWRAATLALPVLVWFIGSFYLFGDLGKWLDDYAAHVRDPVGGSFEWNNLLRYPWWFFWRPLHVQLVFTLQTLLWNHDWLNHLFSALMHALACWSMWRSLHVCGVRPLLAGCAALIMLSAPQGFEAIFWPATVSTTIAAAACFWACRIVVRFAQYRHKSMAVPTLAVLGFAIPCLYEQPAAALAALPVLYLAAMRTETPHRGLVKHLTRMVLALAPCGLAVIAYLACYLATVRKDPMAREGQFIAPDALSARAEYTYGALADALRPLFQFEEARSLGWALLNTPIGLASLAAVAVLAIVWLGRHLIALGRTEAHAQQTVRPLALACFALAAVLLAMLPVALIGGAAVTPRLTYFPLACVLVTCAALVEAILRWTDRRQSSAIPSRILAGACALATLALLSSGLVTLVGLQSMYQRRHAADMAQLTALASLLPTPQPGTIIVPIALQPDAASPAAFRLRNSFQCIWQSPWAMNTMVKHVYKRTDVHAACIYMGNQSNAIMRLGDPTLITWSHYLWKLPTPRMIEEFPPFPQARIVPVEIDKHGRVALVSRISTRTLDADQAVFDFPQAAASSIERELATPVQTGNPWIFGWRWASKPLGPNGQRPIVKFPRIASWGAAARAIRMHPATPVPIHDGQTDAMEVDLPPSDRERTLIFHATFAEQSIDQSVQGDGVELVFTIAGTEARATRMRVDPIRVRDGRLWVRHEVPLPPSRDPVRLKLECLPGPSGSTQFDRVIVTCGEIAPSAPAAK